ncbi:MAG TPA: hypothetical protein VGB55_09730 [Tepidisphaeraceae bacterium]|jgi:hypothetical protein
MTRFQLTDVFACALAACLLLGLAVVGRRQAQEFNAIAECSVKLKRIGQGLLQYQELSGGQFPRTRYVAGDPITAYTGVDADNPFADDGPAINDVTAAAFLLARVVELPGEAFICPGAQRHGLAETNRYTNVTVLQRSNFRARLYYSYALTNMYPDASALAAGYDLNGYTKQRNPRFAIAADTNPGGEGVDAAKPGLSRMQMRMANSPNHQRDGQNVLFASGAVEFLPSPFVGVNNDNIYASATTFPTPASAEDNVMLPHWAMGPNLTAQAVDLRRWVFSGAVILTAVGLVLIVLRNRHRPERVGLKDEPRPL